MKKQISFTTSQRGFTLIELMVSVGIFALMTTFLLAKYGTFNQSILLTNLAYDVALTIRNAQSYGLNVRSVGVSTESFDTGYGVHFSKDTNTTFTFFEDRNKSGIYSTDKKITDFQIKRGSTISELCVSDGDSGSECEAVNTLNVTFIRPNPDGIIKADGNTSQRYRYAQITLQATDGNVKKIEVRSTGQIAITN